MTISENSPEEISVEVHDEDIKKEDFMGMIMTDPRDIIEAKKLENKWVDLEKCKSGKVRISTEYFPAGTLPITNKEELKKEEIENTTTIIQDGQKTSEQNEQEVVPVSKKVSLPAGCITLTVHRARDLEKKCILGKADPYFVVKHGTKTYQYQTVNNEKKLRQRLFIITVYYYCLLYCLVVVMFDLTFACTFLFLIVHLYWEVS